MKNLMFYQPPNPDGREKPIPKFFEDYPSAIIEQRLWSIYSARMFMAPPDINTATELHFYEDLVHLLQSLAKYNSQFETTIVPSFGESTLVSMEGIVNLIKHAIPVGMIYNLSKVIGKIDLMIVLEKSCTKGYAEFENMIDLALLGYEDGTCTVHNYGLLNAQIIQGHVFYTQACVAKNLIYRKNTEEAFSLPNKEAISAAKEKSALIFNACLQKAVNFYDGAQFYIERNVFEMAIFMLHQACELTYRCLLNVLRGKDLKSHSPAVLRKHIKRFAPEVIGVFSEIEAEELYYLQLLEDAYTQSRYELDYSIDHESLAFLNKRVGLLQDRVKILAANW